MKQHVFLALTAISSLLFSCKKESTPDSPSSSSVSYQLRTSNSSSVIGRTDGEASTFRTDATVTWTSGFANVDEIRFEAKSKENEISYKSKTDRRIDLFGNAMPIGDISIPSGEYKEVKYRFGLAPVNGEPALELVGSYQGTPIVLRVSNPFEIKGKQKNVSITDNSGYTAITNINLSYLMKDISASALNNATRTNGQILISSTSNTSLYNKLLKNLRDLEDEGEFRRR